MSRVTSPFNIYGTAHGVNCYFSHMRTKRERIYLVGWMDDLVKLCINIHSGNYCSAAETLRQVILRPAVE